MSVFLGTNTAAGSSAAQRPAATATPDRLPVNRRNRRGTAPTSNDSFSAALNAAAPSSAPAKPPRAGARTLRTASTPLKAPFYINEDEEDANKSSTAASEVEAEGERKGELDEIGSDSSLSSSSSSSSCSSDGSSSDSESDDSSGDEKHNGQQAALAPIQHKHHHPPVASSLPANEEDEDQLSPSSSSSEGKSRSRRHRRASSSPSTSSSDDEDDDDDHLQSAGITVQHSFLVFFPQRSLLKNYALAPPRTSGWTLSYDGSRFLVGKEMKPEPSSAGTAIAATAHAESLPSLSSSSEASEVDASLMSSFVTLAHKLSHHSSSLTPYALSFAYRFRRAISASNGITAKFALELALSSPMLVLPVRASARSARSGGETDKAMERGEERQSIVSLQPSTLEGLALAQLLEQLHYHAGLPVLPAPPLHPSEPVDAGGAAATTTTTTTTDAVVQQAVLAHHDRHHHYHHHHHHHSHGAVEPSFRGPPSRVMLLEEPALRVPNT